MTYDVKHLNQLVQKRDVTELRAFMETHNLVVANGRIKPREPEPYTAKADLYHFRQYSAKIRLNSCYGALLNVACRFFDDRIGQSTTLSGRSIIKHMNATINQIITGEYDYQGKSIVYGDTDSVAGDSIIVTNYGKIEIADLFRNHGKNFCQNNDKEYVLNSDLKVQGYDKTTGISKLMPINYIYRHRVSKPRYRITDSSGRSVVVTGDHSIMVMRNDVLVEIKPSDLKLGDILIVSGE